MTTLIKRKSIEADAFARESRPRYTPRYAPVTFSELGGVRYLHFGTEWVQGAMRLSKPDRIELEYAQQMMAWLLFMRAPKQVVQLGLGTGSLTKFCHQQFKRTQTTAVELNPAVVVAARSMFQLPDDDRRLTVIEGDAWDFVTDASRHGTADVVQIDLYDATARGPVLDSPAFYKACRSLLTAPGMLTMNLFGDHASFPKNIRRLKQAFDDRVLFFPEVHDGNIIVLAFNGPQLSVEWKDVEARAKIVEAATGLPAKRWVKQLRSANGDGGTTLTI
ncbi:spermidine synthase [Pandoraea terrae]|uniref:Spermidine synthase n=1 Tax=Pandoraea terrae TaxID=1537710 RepID=A0A5E4VR91_9BURK|nr:spermidine synthase [Pandoraea terrae]VVE13570.1 spermidine synthase [Pandoraea terrae]